MICEQVNWRSVEKIITLFKVNTRLDKY